MSAPSAPIDNIQENSLRPEQDNHEEIPAEDNPNLNDEPTNDGFNDKNTPEPRSKKKPNIPFWPRRAYDKDIWKTKKAYEKQKKEWATYWQSRPVQPKNKSPMSYKDIIKLKFFGHQSRKEDVKDPIPRCRSCRVGGNAMPLEDVRPDGSEFRLTCPCGCDFAAASLEYYYELLGLYAKADIIAKEGKPTRKLVPKTTGASAYEALLRWEIDYDVVWSMDNMINAAGERISLLQKSTDSRLKNNAVLSANFELPEKPQNKKRKAAVLDKDTENQTPEA